MDWLEMMVGKARLMFYTIDPCDIGGYCRLGCVGRLACEHFVPQDSQGGPRVQLSQRRPCIPRGRCRRLYLMGQDGFGMAARWVPSMSVSTYLSRGTNAVKVLKDLEAKTASFWASGSEGGAGTGWAGHAGSRDPGLSGTNERQPRPTRRTAMATARKALDKAEDERSTQRGLLNDTLVHLQRRDREQL